MKIFFVTLILISSAISLAQTSTTTTTTTTAPTDSRAVHTFGIELTEQGDNVGLPSTFVALGFNLVDAFRISAEYGATNVNPPPRNLDLPYTPSNSTTQSFLGGRAALFVPGWNFSPTIGAAYIHGFPRDFVLPADYYDANLGLEWQMPIGLTLGGGLKVTYNTTSETVGYLQGGWFF